VGHTRLGRLPKTRRFNEVAALPDDSPEVTEALAAAAIAAADTRFRQLANDPSLNYAFWLLVRIASAAQSGDFSSELQSLGLETSAKGPFFPSLPTWRTRFDSVPLLIPSRETSPTSPHRPSELP
jgi:hypothetical protein